MNKEELAIIQEILDANKTIRYIPDGVNEEGKRQYRVVMKEPGKELTLEEAAEKLRKARTK